MKILVGGVEVHNVKRDFVVTERLDEELDSGVIIFYNSVSTEYDPLTAVSIAIENNEVVDYEFVVDNDFCLLVTKQAPYVYQHTMALIEPTKLLERQIVDNLAFTQPRDTTSVRYHIDDVLERMNAVTPLETSARWEATRKFYLDTTLLSELSAIASPQFFFYNQNFLQAVNEVFKYLSGIARVKGYEGTLPIVTKDDFNKVLEDITLSHHFNIARSNNSEYYVNKLDINLENGISDVLEVFPAEPNVAVLTTDSFVMTTNDLQLELPKNIYAVRKLYIILDYTSLIESDGPTIVTRAIDITDVLYEKKLYDTLPIDETGVPSKYGKLVYQQGSNKITGFGNSFPQFWGMFPTTSLEKILADYETYTISLYPYGPYTLTSLIKIRESNVGEEALKGNIGFRVEYYPYITERVQVQRQLPNNTLDYMITSNQSGKSLDINRMLSNAQGTINRLSNGELFIEKSAHLLADCYKIGQRVTGNYIITMVENQINNGYYQSKGTLTKNFNRLSQYVGVDREFRQYEIPLNEVVNRNLIYNEYVTLSTTVRTGETADWETSGIALLRYMFASSYASHYGTVGGVIATTKDAESAVIGNFVLSCSKSAYSNSNIFHFKFKDNQVAYYYPTKSATTFYEQMVSKLTPVRYVSFNDADLTDLTNGTFEYMDVKLIMDDPAETGAALTIDVADIDAASTHYDTVNATGTYDYGLYYHLTTPWTDYMGTAWNYVLLSQSRAYTLGFLEQDIIADLIYSMFPATGNPVIAFTSHPLWLKNQYSLTDDQYKIIKRQQEASLDTLDVYFKSGYAYTQLDDLVVKKDPSEAISMTYQLHFVSRNAEIIVGPTLSTHSPFISSRTNLTSTQKLLYVYVSTDYYRDGDKACKGAKYDSSAWAYFAPNNTYVANTEGFSIATTATLTTYNSWAIGDGDGNLYIGVNRDSAGTLASVVHLQFKNKL